MIEIKGISKIYKRSNTTFTALKDITINIEKGEFLTVVGPSGAGKSTLLHIIGGLTQPDSGNIFYNGKDLYKLTPLNISRYRKKHLGFMFQQFHLMPYLTVLDNIRLACYDQKHYGKIDYFLGKCALISLRNKFPSELSVGEKQRTAFIRAIISNPEILLADEPTGNLDPVNSSNLMSLIKEYHENKGTVVLVSHNPSISEYATREITLENGIQIVTPARRVNP